MPSLETILFWVFTTFFICVWGFYTYVEWSLDKDGYRSRRVRKNRRPKMIIQVGDTITFDVMHYKSNYKGGNFVETGLVKSGKVVKIRNEDYYVVKVDGDQLPYMVHRDNIKEVN